VVWCKTYQAGGGVMNLFEGLLLTNIVVSLWFTYTIGKIQADIEVIYEGLSLAMKSLETK